MIKKRLIIGSGFEENKHKFNKSKFYKILDTCLENKINVCDTADDYFNGDVVEFISKYPKKKKFKIINKFYLYNDLDVLKKNLDNSLRKLNLDKIYRYMPHWPTQSINFEKLADFAYYCLYKNKVEIFGLSNFNLPMIKKFRRLYKEKFAIQFELNIRNFDFNKKLISYCKKNNIEMMCYGINRNFPENLEIYKNSNLKNSYEFSLQWISSLKNISPVIKSLNKKNLINNIKAFKSTLKKDKNIYVKSNFKKININRIKKIYSGSGVVYKNLKQAKINKFNLKPSPLEISKEIKKNGLLKPFYFKKIKLGYALLSGQARYWGYRLIHKKRKKISGIIID